MGDPTPQASHDLGPQLEPALVHACDGRLRDIEWFRTDWQRGGSATAHAVVEDDDGQRREVVVKLPVGPKEFRFATTLGRTDAPTPRIAHAGTEVGGYDLAWLVMERLPGNPLAAHLHRQVFDDLASAAAGFYRHAGEAWPVARGPEPFDWATLIARSRELVKVESANESQSWSHALRDVQKHLGHILAKWNARDFNSWCHGDLHGGNAMHRPDGSAWGPGCCVLFDFAEVHAGHWVEDAVYLEKLYWAKPEVLDGAKPVSLIAKARRAEGLDTSDDYAGLANIRRLLGAAAAPALNRRDAHPRFLHAALEMLHKLMPQVCR